MNVKPFHIMVVEHAGPQSRRVPQQDRSRALVTRVLDAADRLLGTEGGSALTTTRLAREAGVSVGSLYQYFPDTNAIVRALATRHMDAFEALMDEIAEQAPLPIREDPAGALLDLFAARYRAEPGYRALWFGPHLNEELREADRRNKLALADGVRRLVVRLELAHDDERLVILCVAAVHVADALLQEAFRRDPEGDGALLAEARTILRGYLREVAADDDDEFKPGGTTS
jgi:AcrR family transcriptional regulator